MDLKMFRDSKVKCVLPIDSKEGKQGYVQKQLDSGMCQDGIHFLPKEFVSECLGKESGITFGIAF